MESPSYTEVEGEDEDIAKAGHFAKKSVLNLKEISSDEVEVSYKTDVNIFGK